MSQPRPEIRLAPQRGMAVPIATARPKDSRTTLRRLWGYLRQQHRSLMAVVGLVALATAFNLIIPYLVGVAIDRYISVGDLIGLSRLVAVIAGIAVSYAAVVWLYTILMVRVSQFTVRDLRRDLFTKLQTLPLRFFDQRPHGELMSYLTNDVDNVSVVLAENVTTFLSSLLIVIGMAGLMLVINLPLAIVSLIVLPMTAYFTRYIAGHTRQGFRDQQEALSLLNGQIEETITGDKVIHAFGREQAVIDEFIVHNERLRGAAIYAQTYGGLMGPGSNSDLQHWLCADCQRGWLVGAASTGLGWRDCNLPHLYAAASPTDERSRQHVQLDSVSAGRSRAGVWHSGRARRNRKRAAGRAAQSGARIGCVR